MKGVFLDFATVGSDDLDVTPLQDVVSGLVVHEHTAADQVVERIQGSSFVFLNKVRMTRKILEATEGLRFIGLTATGVDNVDIEAAKDCGIAVCNIRAYCTHSVVEHVFAVLLQLAHSIDRYAEDVRAGQWQTAADFCMLEHPIRELSAMTLGIVGYGELGRGVAKVAKAFGMNVLVSRRVGAEEKDAGRVSFDDLLQQSDVVSLHCPLTDNTRNLIGKTELGRMKPGAILINTARGGLVDSQALVKALDGGQIRAAAIDVLNQEPPVDGDPLLDYQGRNLIVTPHIAWATVEARQNAIDELALNAAAFLRGEERNRVV